MGEKKIGGKIVLDGAADFKRAVTSCNESVREFRSELKLIEAEYEGNENSLEALNAKQEVYVKMQEEMKQKVEAINDQKQKTVSVLDEEKNRMEEIEASLTDLNQKYEEAKQIYGENSEEAQKYAKEIAELQKEHDKHEQSVNKLESTIKKYDVQLNEAQADLVKMNRTVSENGEYIKEAEQSYDKCATSIDELGEKTEKAAVDTGNLKDVFLGSFAGNLVATLVSNVTQKVTELGQKLIECGLNAAAWSDDINTLSTQTGIATLNLQEMYYMEDLLDTSTDAITSSMRRNTKAMGEAQKGSETYAEAYEKLGVVIVDNEGHLRDSEDVFWDCIDALGEMSNQTERDATSMQIFGRNAQSINTLIEAGRDGYREYAKEAEAMAYILDTRMLTALNAANDAHDRYEKSVESLGNQLGVIFVPALEATYNRITKITSELANTIAETNEIKLQFDAIGNLDNITDNFQNSSAEISEQAKRAQELTSRLETLSQKTSLTAAEQTLMAQCVQELNQMYPDLSLKIDENTGKLNKNVEAIEAQIAASVKLLEEQEKQETAAEIYENITDLVRDHMKAVLDAVEAEEEYNETLNRAVELGDDYGTVLDGNLARLQDASGAEEMLREELERNIEKYAELTGVTIDLDAIEKELANSTAENADATDVANAAMEDAISVRLEYKDAVIECRVATEEEADELSNLQEAYDNALASARGSIEGQAALFEELKIETETSVGEMTTALESQTEVFKEYLVNLQILKEASDKNLLEDGVLGAISSMGVNGAGYAKELADAITQMSDTTGEKLEEAKTTIEEFNEAFGNREESVAALVEFMAEVETNYGDTFASILEQVQGDSEAVTATVTDQSNAQALAVDTSMKTMVTSIQTEGINMQNTMITALNTLKTNTMTQLGIAEEGGLSTVYRSIGVSIPKSIAKGIEDETDRVVTAVKNMMKKAEAAAAAGASSLVSTVNKSLGSIMS